MNIFRRLIAKERLNEFRLGIPSRNPEERARRVTALAALRNGKGFRQPKAGPKLSRGGQKRKQLEAAGVRRPRLLKVRP